MSGYADSVQHAAENVHGARGGFRGVPNSFRVPMNLLSSKLGESVERSKKTVQGGRVQAPAVGGAQLPSHPVGIQLEESHTDVELVRERQPLIICEELLWGALQLMKPCSRS